MNRDVQDMRAAEAGEARPVVVVTLDGIKVWALYAAALITLSNVLGNFS